MIVLIALIIFLVGITGMGIIIFRKIPALVELPETEIKRPMLFSKLRHKIKNNGTVKSFSSKELLFQKVLSKFRVLTLKTDKKTSNLLVKLRQKSIENKKKFSEDYWKRIRGGK
ncbi:hypothetical protein KJ841_02030 [Patescibacteria group bacterium]|nr:hypothetical protein [Patescibacteria group bacterium]